jgi:hypothetical protein
MAKAAATLGGLLLILLVVSGCAGNSSAPKSLSFDADSDKAIVVVGGSILWAENYRDPDQSLTLHWQAFDPKTLRLMPEGAAFASLTRAAVRLDRDDPYPPVRVLQVEPGSYALVAAGSGVSKTFYVPLQDRYKSEWGTKLVNDFHLDPRKYIEPQAPVAYGSNHLFTVEAGQIVYLGHYEFARSSRYLGVSPLARRFEDEAAARSALAEFPGIAGTMITLDPAKPSQSASR